MKAKKAPESRAGQYGKECFSMSVHKVHYGNVERMSFSKTKEVLDLPYLIELQKEQKTRKIKKI